MQTEDLRAAYNRDPLGRPTRAQRAVEERAALIAFWGMVLAVTVSMAVSVAIIVLG